MQTYFKTFYYLNIFIHCTLFVDDYFIRKDEFTLQESFGKKLVSPFQAYRIVYQGLRGISYFRKKPEQGGIDLPFKERIMLAVTEVNDCPMCAYAHTQIALESGMTTTEIDMILGGAMDHVPKEEFPAVLFAQHYADTKGKPTKEAWNHIIDSYGNRKSKTILSTIRIIMIGNTFGIPFGSFRNRFSRKKIVSSDPRSSLAYEISMLLAIFPFLIVGSVHALIANLFKKSLV